MTNTFQFVVEIDTDAQTGVTLKAQKKWLAENGYTEKEDFRHCGTKQGIVVIDLESSHGFSSNIKNRQFNRFRFKNEEDAIHFKASW